MVSRGICSGDKPAMRDRARRVPAGWRGAPGETIVVGHTQKCNLEKPLMSNARATAHKYHFLHRVVYKGMGLCGMLSGVIFRRS